MRKHIALFICLLATANVLQAQEPRPLRVDDIFALKTVGDPRISPDGSRVAYTVSWMNAKEDDSDTDIYTVPLAGGEAVRMTTSPKPETSPRWSPDGRYLAFLSSRESKSPQVWLLDQRGGDALPLTDIKAGVSAFSWAPNSRRLALIVADSGSDDAEVPQENAPAKPIVIDRLQFKQDGQGYLTHLRRHVYIFNIETRMLIQVTDGDFDDSAPSWSPDGKLIVFSSNRTPDADANPNSDIFIVDAAAGHPPRQLTTSIGADTAPAISPDGKLVTYVAGGDPKDIWYAVNHLAVVAVEGGAPRSLSDGLDRNVANPRFSADGKWILFTIEDGGNSHLARVSIAGGSIERIVLGERSVQAFDIGPNGTIAVLEGESDRPAEISIVSGGSSTSLKRITAVNDEFLKGIRLSKVERFKTRSADGTLVDGFITHPPNTSPDSKLPGVLRIHGGPVSQYTTDFNFEWQILAAHGYEVIAANPRGSSGYGYEFGHAIWADWGNKDFQDVMAVVDYAVKSGNVDENRLGVGGWSYGGILTNYAIAKTNRFKAAISGASETNFLADYGTDHYQRQWESELGLPWQNAESWIKLSPWYNVEKITTPTLVMGGADDMNVPLVNSEQLYQALRRLGRTTELVIYPGQAHNIRKPSYQKDRYERYISWYDKFLK